MDSVAIIFEWRVFATLAVQVYQYASDERLIEASAPALAIILVGIVPVLLLSFRITRSRGLKQW